MPLGQGQSTCLEPIKMQVYDYYLRAETSQHPYHLIGGYPTRTCGYLQISWYYPIFRPLLDRLNLFAPKLENSLGCYTDVSITTLEQTPFLNYTLHLSDLTWNMQPLLGSFYNQ